MQEWHGVGDMGCDGVGWAVVLDLMVKLMMLMLMCGKLCADSPIFGFKRASDMYKLYKEITDE